MRRPTIFRMTETTVMVSHFRKERESALWSGTTGGREVFIVEASKEDQGWSPRTQRMYRVWLRDGCHYHCVGRLYEDGRFQALKGHVARLATESSRWKDTLKKMKAATTVHGVMVS